MSVCTNSHWVVRGVSPEAMIISSIHKLEFNSLLIPSNSEYRTVHQLELVAFIMDGAHIQCTLYKIEALMWNAFPNIYLWGSFAANQKGSDNRKVFLL